MPEDNGSPAQGGKRRRRQSEILRDRRQITRWYFAGMVQIEIAERLGLDQSTISRDLAALHKEWIASTLIEFDAAKGRELAECDNLEYRAWQAYERSCQIPLLNADGDPVLNAETNEPIMLTVAGDPRFLAIVDKAIDRRCRILGVYSPDKIAQTDPTGKIAHGTSPADYLGFTADRRNAAISRILELSAVNPNRKDIDR